MDLAIILIVLLAGIAICIYYYTNRSEEQEINTLENELNIPVAEDIPLQDKTYRIQNRFNNYSQNRRTDAIIDVLNKIHFWLVIIGLYFIIKMIVWVFIIGTKGLIVTELLQMLLENLT